MNIINTVRRLVGLIILPLLLSACGGGSGAETVANPVTTAPTVSNYSGPAPATADVQAFKINVWDNLVPNNRCGTCHNNSQSPRFVRSDDINLAFEAANTVVNLQDPGQSIMVTKVRGGHNCWLTDANACGDIIQNYIVAWAGGTLGAPAKQIQLTAPPLTDPGSSKNFPNNSNLFSTTVYPLVRQYCAGCHNESATVPQSPYFASADVDAAYAAVQSKLDLDNPGNSRLVLRLRNEFHNCWSNCSSNADTMQSAITTFANGISLTQIDSDLVTSKSLRLTNGIVSSSGGRHQANAIALYEFKTGSGNTVFDTSGVEPALNLTLSGSYQWVGGWGVQFTSGKAQGSTTASRKLRNMISSTGEFSIEAWVAPGNVTQDGPARIVSYSGSTTRRNFMLGQTQYNYDTFVRSTRTDAEGEPQLSTADDDEDLQATLQHVVMTYDPVNGRRIYVNGEFTGDRDTVQGGLFTDWDDTFAFAIGSEVDNSNRWSGVVRLLAVHNRRLTDTQISQNFEAGVGEKYYMLFNVGAHVNIPDAYVVFEVSQFDSYGYLFDEPFFTILSASGRPGSIPMKGMRIGLNGRELAVGQAFQNVDRTLNDADYTAANGMLKLSELGTVVPLEKGVSQDEFFLTFERLGSATNVVVEAAPVPPPPPADEPRSPVIGIRDFAEINASMAKLTGVSSVNPQVVATYDAVRTAMPIQPDLGGFISSQQMGVTQLAISYCSALVDNTALRSAYFPGLDFNAAPAAAFANRALLIDPLINNMVGTGLTSQPTALEVTNEVNSLVTNLSACGAGCASDRTVRIVKASCAAVLGSAAMLVQ